MQESRRLALPDVGPRYTHYLFRYPAKFHPPVVRSLLDKFTNPGDLVLDNFCGSGTSLVESAVTKRRSVGVDIDPVAVLVSQAKTRRYDATQLQDDARTLLATLSSVERTSDEYDTFVHDDIECDDLQSKISTEGLWVPKIPKLVHWFRNYVTLDLARIKARIETAQYSQESKLLFLLTFASIIRNVSNADPVPVSGLEVTAHMRRKDAAGRRINPFDHYRNALKKTLGATASFGDVVGAEFEPVVMHADATKLPGELPGPVDAVIASPPYHNAVDYYRRHQLEMYWLDLVADHAERLALLPKYIGRQRIPQKHAVLQEEWEPARFAEEWHSKISAASPQRANDFRHYIVCMRKVFEQLAVNVRPGAPVVLVVGESTWQEQQIPTDLLLAEAAEPHFKLTEQYWYPIKNRYMSYSRHNGANIAQEHVLVLR